MTSAINRATKTADAEPATCQDSRNAYQEAFCTNLKDKLLTKCKRDELADIVSKEALDLLEKIDEVMARYPKPDVYANERAKLGRAAADFRRRDNAQAGRGAYGTRKVLNGDGVFHDHLYDHWDDQPNKNGKTGTNYEVFAAHQPDFVSDLVDHDERQRLLHQALLQLSTDEREILSLIDGEGRTVTSVANLLGLSRETVSRKRSRALRTVRLAVAP